MSEASASTRVGDGGETPLAPELIAAIQDTQAEIARAIYEAKLHDDPLGLTLIAQSKLLTVLQRLFIDGTLSMRRTIEDARQPVDYSAIADRIGRETRHVMNIHAVQYLRINSWRNVLIAAGALFAVALGFLGGGYWWGRSSANTEFHETEAGLQQAFARGPEAARQWWSLMAWNDPREALAQCQGRTVSVQGGRRACGIPMWIDPPPAPGRQ